MVSPCPGMRAPAASGGPAPRGGRGEAHRGLGGGTCRDDGHGADAATTRPTGILLHRVDPPTLPPSTGSYHARRDAEQVPGVAIVFSGGAPVVRVLAVGSALE